MTRFHTLTIKNVQKETKHCVSVAFEIPDALQNDYSFMPGQHLVLKAKINGKDIRRSYSICSSPSEKELRVAIKQIDNGLFSTYANNELLEGSQIEVMPPTGNFTANHNPETKGDYVAFAAGSGITPIISIIQSTLESNPESSFTLFYGNRNQQSIIFNERLAGIKNQYMRRLRVFHILSRENPGNDLFYGRIDEKKCKVYCEKIFDPKTIDSYYICGPAEMTEVIRLTLKDAGVDPSDIHFELFTAPDQKIEKKQKASPSKQDVFDVQIDIKIDDKSYAITAQSNEGTILEIANNAGKDLPFSCKGGVCCTCRAKLVEGKVSMDVNYALEEDELKAGYILTCQARPQTKKLKVDFDA